MCRRWWFVGGTLAAVLLGAGPTAPQAAEPQEGVFPMKEVSVFEEAQKAQVEKDPLLHQALLGGQYASCSHTPEKEVKKYPKLHSKRPLYGSVRFDADPADRKSGVEYHFVLDESEPAGKPTTKAAAKKPQKRSLLKALVESITGPSEEPAPAVKGNYDRLYFDVNGDLDLTNDPVLKRMKDPPQDLAPDFDTGDAVRTFEYLDVPFDYGPGLGKRPLRVAPTLCCYVPENAWVTFLPTVARKGKIRIGHEKYTAYLTQSETITGRFDRPLTRLLLVPAGGPAPRRTGWWENWLCTMRRVDGRLYRISATPSGDKLIVKPYDGDWGVLEVGPGKRKIKRLGVAGVLMAKQQFVVPAGEVGFPLPADKPARHKLPVGDYRPMYLTVDFGRVAMNLSMNSYAVGGGDQPDKQPAYGLKIRKDKPCVLDFSAKPTVLFPSDPLRP